MRGTALASVLIVGALATFLAACQFISMRRVYAEWVSISLIAAFVWTFRLWFIDERRSAKEAKAKHFDAKTLDRLIDSFRASTEAANQVVERKEDNGEITAVPIATILQRSVALQQYFKANFAAARHAVVICDDPIAFAAIDICCMASKIELIALPAGTATVFVQKVLEALDSVVIIAASHAAQKLCVECRAPADVLIIDRAIPPREFGAAYGSPVRIRFITEFFDGKAPRAQRKAPDTPRIEPSDCYTSVYGLGEDEALSVEKVSHDAFLQLIRLHRARLSSGTHTVALCATPLAFLQQRALFYAALSLGMDVTAASTDDADVLTASALSLPLSKALLLYSAAVTSAHSLWLFRKVPWVEQQLYCIFRRLHAFYAALGWMHRRLTLPSLAPRPTHVFVVDQAPIPSNVFDLLEGYYGCPVSQIAPHRAADTLTLSDGISISAAYLEAVYRSSPLVDDIFLTTFANGRLVAVITPDREGIAASLKRADPVEWQEVVTGGKRAIIASLRRLRRAFHLPAGCVVREALLVAYSLAEHSGFRGPFGEFVRPAVRRYYEGALEALGEAEGAGPKPPSEFSTSAALHRAIRFPCAIDIGGTSCKVVFFEPAAPVELPSYCIFERLSIAYETAGLREGTWPLRETLSANGRQRGILRCMRLPTEKIPHFVEFLTAQAIPLKSVLPRVPATGGGASRFAALIAAQTGVTLAAQSEFATAVAGLNFLLETVPNAIVRYDVERDEAVPVEAVGAQPWPYLLVNVGSGISILRCDAPGDCRRVSGSALGGGTFWGLCRLLTNATTWEEIDELTRVDGPGDAAAVDLLVRDIYGQGAAVPGDLRPDTLASSFGKLASRGFRAAPKASDYVRSLLLMMSYNITQIAFLWSQNLGIRNVYFCGGFLQNNSVVMRHIAQSMAYWTAADAVEAKFVRHNGYLGAIGGLLCEA